MARIRVVPHDGFAERGLMRFGYRFVGPHFVLLVHGAADFAADQPADQHAGAGRDQLAGAVAELSAQEPA